MRKCDTCGREYADGEPVACEDALCPLVEHAAFGDENDAQYDPTVMEPRQSREEVIGAALETLTEEERAALNARAEGKEPPKKVSKPPKLRPPPVAKKRGDEQGADEKRSVPKPPPTEKKATEKKASQEPAKKPAKKANLSLAELRAEIRASRSAGESKPSLAPPPVAAADDVPDTEPVDVPPPEELDDEDPTIIETDFDVDDVPIPDDPEQPAAHDSYEQDYTVEADRPDLDAIRKSAREAAQKLNEGEVDGEFEVGDTVFEYSLDEEPSDPDLSSVEDAESVIVSEDPNFGQPPYQVIETPTIQENHTGAHAAVPHQTGGQPVVRGHTGPQPRVHQTGPQSRVTPKAQRDLLRDHSGAHLAQSLEEATSPETGLRRWVNVDSIRDVVVALLALVGCAVAMSMAIANWWSPGEVAVATFGAVLVACAAVGGILVSEKSSGRRVNVVIRSAGIAAPFALVATLCWLSEDVRAWVFDHALDPENTVALQTAMRDESPIVAAEACRTLVQQQVHHNFVIGVLDERPSIAQHCMEDLSSANHRIAANRLAEIWQSRMHSSADASTCDYVAHYTELPVGEVDKFYDLFDCAFTGTGEATEKCCGQHLIASFGKGSELIPGVELVAAERPDPEMVRQVLGPILYPEQLGESGRRNASAIELDDPELYDVALELACQVMERPEATATAMDHFTAIANDHCENQEIPGRRADDWRLICEIAQAPRVDNVTAEAQFCTAVDMVNVARAIDAASIQVFVATLREESRELESGIVVGTVREAVEQRENRDEQDMEFLYGRINARYDVRSKQKSLKALSERQKKLEKQMERADEITARRNSARSRKARNRRRNIAEGILNTHEDAAPEWRENNR